ncbi:MAG: hypothetical protein H6730_02980 [Deltaproteobacteria bacterium]|nr:hypothetical protein [Deltaproteobacteria bacterium]
MSVAVLAALLLGAPEPAAESYALIIANNQSFESVLAPLTYADDDGARYHELLALVARRVEVLTVLDEGSQRLYPATAAVARPPSGAELTRALDALFADMEAANRRGVRTTFYFVYVGHGSVEAGGQGAMHLLDRRFTRADVFHDVIARSPATVNHLIIDACNSYLLVAKRGAGEVDDAVDAAVDRFVEEENLDRYPNTGIVVATSRAADVHEWSEFQAGVFSHEVRSALVGGADVDGDGAVTYGEVRAFLGAANQAVQDPRARLEPYVRPPRIRVVEPLFDGRAAPRHLVVPPELAGRYYLEDSRGVRFADVNMGRGSAVRFTLLPERGYYLRGEGLERRIPADAVAELDARSLEATAEPFRRRGAEDESFRRFLFATPFNRAYFDGFAASPIYRPGVKVVLRDGEVPTGKVVALSLGGASVAALAAAVGFAVSAGQARSAYDEYIGSQAERDRLGEQASSRATWANVFFGTSAALAVGAAVTWFVWD